MTSPTETWLPCTKNSAYEVSDLGRIRRKNAKKECLRTIVINSGYEVVCLAGASYLVHRLVAEAFHGQCPPGYETDHIDGDKLNNRANNLEWVTRKENIARSKATGRHGRPKGSKSMVGVFVQMGRDGQMVAVHRRLKDAAQAVGKKSGWSISRCLRGKCHTAGGFKWVHVQEPLLLEAPMWGAA